MYKSKITLDKDLKVSLYDFVAGDENARVCKDVPEEACRELPRNFFIHLGSGIFTKIGDELASAKLVLTWLLNFLGVPVYLTGFLVPIREAGSLLPQLVIAGYIRKAPVRKWFWIAGCFFEGTAVLGMAITASMLRGPAAGWTVIALLLIFSLARGVRSVASKDVMGKTVSKLRRGTLMGYATAIAGIFTVLVGFYTKTIGKTQIESADFFVYLLSTAALLWFLATLLFTFLREPEGSTEGGGNALTIALQSLKLLKSDQLFRRFVITRALFLSTALSIPYYVILAQEVTDSSMQNLGLLIVATGIASSISAPFWGRYADKSSRVVLVTAAIIAFALGLLVFAITSFELLQGGEYIFAGAFLTIGVAHSGVRLGRKTYLVDLATPEKRASYVALSNTLIGILILLGSGFGFMSYLISTEWVILVLSIIAGLAGIKAFTLKELHQSD